MPAPGNAQISCCPDWITASAAACLATAAAARECSCTRACGDIAMWFFGPGNDQTHMSCDLCGGSWDAGYPGWLAQRVPDRLLASTSG